MFSVFQLYQEEPFNSVANVVNLTLPYINSEAVIPAKAGIRAPASRCDWRGESPLSGDARS